MDKDFLNQIDRVGEWLDTAPTKLDDEVLICECFCVSVQDIRQACSSQNKVDLDVLSKNFSLGLGCQSCLKRSEDWINKIF